MCTTSAGEKTQTFADLPFLGTAFRQLHWLGFSSTAKGDEVFYVDNLRFQ